MAVLTSLLADAQEEITALRLAILQTAERFGAQRVRQMLFALVLFLCQWARGRSTEQTGAQLRPRRLTPAQAFRLGRGRRRTLAAVRRSRAAAIVAQRPIAGRCLLPLPRAYTVFA